MNTKKALLAFALLSLAALCPASHAQSQITGAVDANKLMTLRGNTHPLAQAKFDRGAAPESLPMNHLLLVLKRSPAQEAALDKLLAEQQDRTSPNFHKWLTPAQFGQQFGASDQDIADITSWLESYGLEVNHVANGRNLIDFSGTAGQVESAFHTTIHKYVLANGEQHWANSSDPQIPAALVSVVAGVNKLNDFRPRAMHHFSGQVTRSKLTGKMRTVKETTFPNLDCYTSNTNCYGVGPYDFAKIYNVLPLWNTTLNGQPLNGTGQTIAIVSDSDVYDSDYSTFRSLFGLPALVEGTTFNRILPTGSNPGVQACAANSDEEEAIVDVEWSGAVAPGATLDLVISPSEPSESCNGVNNESGFPFGGDYSAFYIVDHDIAPILSYSYGECELGLGGTQNTFYNNEWQQAQGEGITVLVASGDNGSAGCDSYDTSEGSSTVQPAQFGLAVNGVASTPYNVAVGGTDFDYPNFNNPSAYWTATNSTSGTTQTLSAVGYIPEMAYNDTCTDFAIYQGLIGAYGFPNSGGAINACNSAVIQDSGAFVIGPAGGGGGASNCTAPTGPSPQDCTAGGYAKPSWQKGTGVPSDGARDLPDLSLFAGDGTISATSYLVCEADLNSPPAPCSLTEQSGTDGDFVDIQAVGGTSVSTQAMAGVMALINQKYGPQGNANPVIYTLAASGSASSIFNDVTAGTNAMPCETGTTDCDTTAMVPIVSPNPGSKIAVRDFQIACALGIGLLLFFGLRSKRQRWSIAAASLALVLVVASVGCGGGSGGTAEGGGGTGNAIGILSGYSAGTGFDLATGWGSVNVANLVNATGWAAAPPSEPPAAINRPAVTVPVATLALACALCLGLLFLGLRRKQLRWTTAVLLLAFALSILTAARSSASTRAVHPASQHPAAKLVSLTASHR